mmetsp:Transcript_24276/g.76323  ORF Transcript_24276/g.76323 Transcript_24276/m.76323 type:complete len:238 (+) Transcript_24276:477-1190(+)
MPLTPPSSTSESLWKSASFCFSWTNCCMTFLPCTRASHCDSFCSLKPRTCSSRASMRLWSSASVSPEPLAGVSCTWEFGLAFSSAAPNGHQLWPRETSSPCAPPATASTGDSGLALRALRPSARGAGERPARGAGASPECLLPPMASQGSERSSSALVRLARSGSTSFLQSLRAASEKRASARPKPPKKPWATVKSRDPWRSLFSSSCCELLRKGCLPPNISMYIVMPAAHTSQRFV